MGKISRKFIALKNLPILLMKLESTDYIEINLYRYETNIRLNNCTTFQQMDQEANKEYGYHL